MEQTKANKTLTNLIGHRSSQSNDWGSHVKLKSNRAIQEQSRFYLESLILAQSERWRRA